MSRPPEDCQWVTVLGATGSIGRSTLEVVALHPERYRVFALTGHRQIDLLAQQCARFGPRVVVVADQDAAEQLRAALGNLGFGGKIEIGCDREALARAVTDPQVDVVMAAIVGAAGLEPTLAAARAGKKILLANKEALVMAGEVFGAACKEGKAQVLPIDSEHNAVFQCLPGGSLAPGVRRIILTASGGPFLRLTRAQMATVTPEQACAHPNWSMGRKISVDSATMMNKGLELIEAHYLFGVAVSSLEVLVHPQSIVHSLVEYDDGSVLAQLGNPDMRTPIAHALAYPQRVASGVEPLSLAKIGTLSFEDPDLERFPCLRLAIEALAAGGRAPCVLNAANEIAVAGFLSGKIGFGGIGAVNAEVLARLGQGAAGASVGAVLELDAEARALAADLVAEGRRQE
jgi:1-deoxy-D-xylulose-5-phosphate reductoisomerase